MKTWTLVSEALEQGALTLLRFEIRDALSGLYEIVAEVQPVGSDDPIDGQLDDVFANGISLGATGEPTRIWGVVRSVTLLTTQGATRPTYRIVIGPRLWNATHTKRSRVFQDSTAVEIALAVLDGMGLVANADYETRLVTTYPKREYTVQYEETDYAFVSRLLEDEGIATHFEQGAEHEKLVLSDSNGGMTGSIGDVPYAARAADPRAGAISQLTATREIVSQELILSDYDWRKPLVTLSAKATIDAQGRGLVFTGATHYVTQAYGKQLATARAQELAVRRDTVSGTRVGPLHAGDRFTLTGHYLARLDVEYLVLEARQRFDQAFDATTGQKETDETAFVAIATTVVFRPARVTPAPHLDGLLYATIDGGKLGTLAPVDKDGRYKVILPWDVAATPGGKASRWIRMAQSLSGGGYGMHFPLREGAEVVLSHIEGDPDRPIIVGATPNAVTPSPVTGANATQSVIRTSSGIYHEWDDDVTHHPQG